MLEVIDLAKRYGPVVALDGAIVHRRPGRIVGFLGPNGAGKTTTMRCIFGLARPDRGEVRWDGKPIDRAARLRFGYMPEQRGLYPRMRVGRAAQLLRPAARAAAARRRTPPPPAGSSGWAWPTGRGRSSRSCRTATSSASSWRSALVHDPELLVLDEPFSGLDPIGIATMTEILRERAAAGVGVVFSSHQLDLVEDVCEDVVIIARGRIVAAGAIDELRAASGRRHLEVEVAGSDGSWLDGARRPDRPRAERRPRQAARRPVDVDLDGLLAAGAAAGAVRRVRLPAADAVRAVHGSGHAGEPVKEVAS